MSQERSKKSEQFRCRVNVPEELAAVADQVGLPPEQLAALALQAFVAGLDAEAPTIELPLRLVEQRLTQPATKRGN